MGWKKILLVLLFMNLPTSVRAQDTSPSASDAISAGESDATPPLADTWKNLARLRNHAALRLFEKGNHPAALEAFREASRLDPDEPEISNNLAYLLHLLGNRAEAERYYRRTLELDPDRYVAHVNLADLLGEEGETPERLAEAASLLVRARELKGNRASIILRQARVAGRRGLFEEAVRFWNEYVAAEPPGDEKKLEIGDLYVKFGREDEALAWYRQVDARSTEVKSQAARRIWQIEVDREARRLGWQPRGSDVPLRARMLASQARARMQEGDLVEARRLLDEAVSQAPQSAEAHLGLAELHELRKDWSAAELEYLRALAMESANADAHARLGRLYGRWPDGGRTREAAIFLSNALKLRPDWSSLRLELARARQAGGDLTGALAEVNRLLADAVNGDERDEADRLRVELLRLIPATGASATIPPTGDAPQATDFESVVARARALVAHGSPEGALLELRRLASEERRPAALLLEARILHSVQRRNEAVVCLRQVLSAEPGNSEASQLLGAVLAEDGRLAEAMPYLRVAAGGGDPTARFLVAQFDFSALAAGRPTWWVALLDGERVETLRSELLSLLDSGASFPERERAEALSAALTDALAQRWYLPAALLALGVLGLLLLLRRRYGGMDLAELMREHPEAAPELHRILAAVRHEVLKHNTLMLTALVKGLSQGQNVADDAARLHEGLFGSRGGSDGAQGRLQDYRNQLVQVGRSHGARINLRRDPAFGALLQGFERLERCASDLLKVEFLPPQRRSRLATRLGEAARMLNVEGYEALRNLLDRFRTTRVDRNILVEAFNRVVAEPDLSARGAVELQYGEEGELPCGIPVPASAVDDILANLIRNAVQAMLRSNASPAVVGLGLRRVADPVTGIERAWFLVADRSPEPLGMEQIRGGRAGGGLSIVVELVDRYEGSISVLPGNDGFTKVVAVTFHCTELLETA